VVDGGRARRREVKIGQRSALEAEVLQGLKGGETVIRHPSNDIMDGTRVKK
jgi:HlyD family secretion protein